jgi:hypothetical protein
MREHRISRGYQYGQPREQQDVEIEEGRHMVGGFSTTCAGSSKSAETRAPAACNLDLFETTIYWLLILKSAV